MQLILLALILLFLIYRSYRGLVRRGWLKPFKHRKLIFKTIAFAFGVFIYFVYFPTDGYYLDYVSGELGFKLPPSAVVFDKKACPDSDHGHRLAEIVLTLDSTTFCDLMKKMTKDSLYKPLWKLPNLPGAYAKNPTMTYYKNRDNLAEFFVTFTKNINSISVNWNCYFEFPELSNYFYEENRKKSAPPPDPNVNGIFIKPTK